MNNLISVQFVVLSWQLNAFTLSQFTDHSSQTNH